MSLFRKRFNRQHLKKYAILLLVQVSLYIALVYRNPKMWFEYLLFLSVGLISLGLVPYIIERSGPRSKTRLDSIEGTMDFAEQTLPYFREGLDSESAMIVAEIIKDIANIPAVAITDRKNVLAFIGEGCDKHPVGGPIRTQATLDAIADGEMHIIGNKAEFNCKLENCECPLASAIIVPLLNKGSIIGCLKFYDIKKGEMSKAKIKLAVGIGKMLSMQIELADYDRQYQLSTEAKLDALQAQINPHFLFNSLNTINMYINKEPQYARQLIIRLSTLLRYLLGTYGRFIPLAKELSYLEDYIVIENARYLDKLSVDFNIDANIDDIEIPVFTIQPLVHNAIMHGILPKDSHGRVTINISRLKDELIISVEDDGVGIKEEDMEKVFEPGNGSGCGIGVSNVDERLKILYGSEYGLSIKSRYMKGTIASFKIPISQ